MPFENQNFNSRTYFYHHLNIRLVRYSDREIIFVCPVLDVKTVIFFPDPDSVSKGRGHGRSRNDKEFKVIWQHCFFIFILFGHLATRHSFYLFGHLAELLFYFIFYFLRLFDIWQHCFLIFLSFCLFGRMATLFWLPKPFFYFYHFFVICLFRNLKSDFQSKANFFPLM